MMSGSSKGGTMVAPRSAAIASAIASAVLRLALVELHLGAVARVLAILIAGASLGMTMVAGRPSSCAAAATPWAWLPEE